MRIIKRITVNFITASRMCVALWFVFYHINISSGWKMAIIHSAVWFDMLDGSFARLWHVESKIGEYLDSIADFALCALIIPVVFPSFVWSWEKLLVAGVIAFATHRLARKIGKLWQSVRSGAPVLLFLFGIFISAASASGLIKIIGFTSIGMIIVISFTLRKERARYFIT